MILTSTVDLQKYVSVAANFTFETFTPYITKAINSYTRKYVGNLHVFLDDEASGTGADIKNEAREHLRSAIANFGYFLFTPYNSVMMDSSGMSNVQNEQRKNIEWWQQADIRRELLRSGHESMDFLLQVLEENPEVFTDWTQDFATINKELLVSSTGVFDKYYNIFGSRQTFLALIPSLRQVEDQYVKQFLCPEVITHLKTEALSEHAQKEVKEYLQKAIVAFTISKVCDEGMFLLDATGLKLKYDLLPNEQAKVPDYGKQADQITRTVQKQKDNGITYLQMVRDIIEKNPEHFTQCEVVFINETNSGSGFTPYDTRGVLGI